MLSVHILQSTLCEYIRIDGISPNFWVMLVVSYSLLRGSKEGAIVGMVGGILNDVTYSMTLGSAAVAYAILGHLCGKLHPYCHRENFILPITCTFVGSIFISFMNLLGFILRGRLSFAYYIRAIIVPELIYTVLLTLIIYRISYMINRHLEIDEKKTSNLF